MDFAKFYLETIVLDYEDPEVTF
ncbi:unnamed protein product, partial [Allacma fusca]